MYKTMIENMTSKERVCFQVAVEIMQRARSKFASLGSIDTPEKGVSADECSIEIERAIGMVQAIAIMSDYFDNTTDLTQLLYEVQEDDELRKELYV